MALGDTRGLPRCLKTLANRCLLGAQPSWGPQGGSLRVSTLRTFEFVRRNVSPPLWTESRGDGGGKARMGLGPVGPIVPLSLNLSGPAQNVVEGLSPTE